MQPRWVNEISSYTQRMLPFDVAQRLRALEYGADVETFEDGDDELDAEVDAEDDGSDEDSLLAVGEDDSDSDPADLGPLVTTTRVRIWSLSASPGGGAIAVFIGLHAVLRPERLTFSGLPCRLILAPAFASAESGQDATVMSMRKLSTEARTWEWMYGGGPAVPGVSDADHANDANQTELKDMFSRDMGQQTCVFCERPLQWQGKSWRCQNGHTFRRFIVAPSPASWSWLTRSQRPAQPLVFPSWRQAYPRLAVSAAPNA